MGESGRDIDHVEAAEVSSRLNAVSHDKKRRLHGFVLGQIPVGSLPIRVEDDGPFVHLRGKSEAGSGTNHKGSSGESAGNSLVSSRDGPVDPVARIAASLSKTSLTCVRVLASEGSERRTAATPCDL